MDVKEPLLFTSPREWRAWLSRHHATAKAAWLIISKKNSGKTGLNYNQALEEALCYGWIDGIMKSIDEGKFVLRYSPRKKGSVWSRINKEKAERLIAAGRMTKAGLAAIEEAKKNGAWDGAYTSLKGDEIPADLAFALSANKTALTNFQNFANSYRNMYIGWITGARTAATRRERIKKVFELSLANKKLITD